MVGFDRVAALARDAGIKSARGTPSMAIGSYDATPLDMAGAYTVFANGGLHLDPWMLASVRTPTGDVITDYTPTSKQVLDPRVAYLTTNMMESSDCNGDGNRRRRAQHGIHLLRRRARPAPATMPGSPASPATCSASSGWATTTTPTSRSRAPHAAAPIWAEFMKKAVQLPQYSDTHEFTPPDGVEIVSLDKATNLLSRRRLPDDYDAAFLDGTAPTDTCDHPPRPAQYLQKIFGLGKPGTD